MTTQETNIEQPTAEAEVVSMIKNTIDEQVSTKADKADVEGLTATTDTHSTDIEAIKSAHEADKVANEEIIKDLSDKLEGLEATIKSAHATQETNTMNGINFEKGAVEGLGNDIAHQKFSTIKSVDTNQDVPGGRVDTNSPYYTLAQANILRNDMTVMPASGGVVKLPTVGGISWASEENQPTSARNAGGTLASKNVTIETWVSENAYSIASLEDVPAMDSVITNLMAQQLGSTEIADTIAVIKGSSELTGITTGDAAALPAANEIVAKTQELIDQTSSAYRVGAKLYVSQEYYGKLSVADNNGLVYDVVSAVNRFHGFEIVIVDALEAAEAGALVAFFGNLSKGMVLATASTMSIGRFDQTRPGAMTYFGRSRFKSAIWDESAIKTLKVGA